MKTTRAPAPMPRVKRSQPADAMTRSPRPPSRRARLFVLASVCVGAWLTAPVGAASDGADEASVREGSVTIETIDGTAPAIDDPSLVDALTRIADDQATARADRAGALDEEPALGAAVATADVGGLSVTYLTDPPPDVREVVEAAAASWSDVLSTNSGPVEIEFDWRTLPPNILGLAAPTTFHRDPRLPTDAFYPVALANTLLATDLEPERAEITITLASNLDGVAGGWYVDPDPVVAVPADSIDLFTVVVHEIGHGLGFTGSARNGTLDRDPVVFDLLARFGGEPVVGSDRVSEALTSNDLFITIGGDRTAALYAPSNFINRVSFSHFDESANPSDPGGLMTPAFGSGEVNRTIDAATLGVMERLGWSVAAPTTQPRVVSVEGGDGRIVVRFDNDLGRVGLPALTHTVTVSNLPGDPAFEQTVTVAGDADAATVDGVPNDSELVVTVRADGATGPSLDASVTARTRPSTVAVSGVGEQRTVRWSQPGAPSGADIVYVVERRRGGGAWTEIGRTLGTSLIDAPLAPGVYQYRVTADADGVRSAPAVSIIEGVADSAIRPMELDGQIGRLYIAFLGRQPDAEGMAFWLGRRASGASIVEIADGFAASPEFAAILGEADDGRFVDAVYESVLGRPADADGRAFWIAQLGDGLTRGELMTRFSDAPEFVTLTGTEPVSGNAGGVERLYHAFLQRWPDPEGLAFWTSTIEAGASLEDVASQFATSVEFTTTYGPLSDDDFLSVVYDNVLGRRAERSGFEFWRARLAAGEDRGAVMAAFANSPEFIIATGTLP